LIHFALGAVLVLPAGERRVSTAATRFDTALPTATVDEASKSVASSTAAGPAIFSKE
jgi:hypothetical protein